MIDLQIGDTVMVRTQFIICQPLPIPPIGRPLDSRVGLVRRTTRMLFCVASMHVWCCIRMLLGPIAIAQLSGRLLRTQAMDGRGQPVWTDVYLISHRDLTAETPFTVLSSGNGTTLTLSARHMVYITDAAATARLPVAAQDVQVRRQLDRSFRT